VTHSVVTSDPGPAGLPVRTVCARQASRAPGVNGAAMLMTGLRWWLILPGRARWRGLGLNPLGPGCAPQGALPRPFTSPYARESEATGSGPAIVR
jgi:hypothetical protein